MISIIGDIHGCYYTLVNLVSKIKIKYSSTKIFSVGDLVDRGNFSSEVVNYVVENRISFVPGNHDYMFYHFYEHPNTIFAKTWASNGSDKTIKSYNNRKDMIQKHIEIIKSRPLFYDLEDCFISHAGISKYLMKIISKKLKNDFKQLNELLTAHLSLDDSILWNRNELADIGKLQVVGHTRFDEVTFEEESNSVYIDTGAFTGNFLSAVIIEKNKIIDVINEKTDSRDIA